jgi:hypothetical protein
MAARVITSMPRPKGLPAAVNFNPSFVSPHATVQLGVECHRERHRRHKDNHCPPPAVIFHNQHPQDKQRPS